MKETAGFITSLFSGLNLRARWAAGLVTAVLILAALWAFESYTGYLFYQTLERRVALLERMHSLANDDIHLDRALYPAYQSAVQDLSGRVDFRLPISPLGAMTPPTLGKAISGSSVWLLILLVGLSSEFKKTKQISGTLIALVLFIAAIAYFFGWLGTIIPTIGNPWVNYIGFPAIQLLILWLLTRRRPK